MPRGSRPASRLDSALVPPRPWPLAHAAPAVCAWPAQRGRPARVLALCCRPPLAAPRGAQLTRCFMRSLVFSRLLSQVVFLSYRPSLWCAFRPAVARCTPQPCPGPHTQCFPLLRTHASDPLPRPNVFGCRNTRLFNRLQVYNHRGARWRPCLQAALNRVLGGALNRARTGGATALLLLMHSTLNKNNAARKIGVTGAAGQLVHARPRAVVQNFGQPRPPAAARSILSEQYPGTPAIAAASSAASSSSGGLGPGWDWGWGVGLDWGES
jgi:hypothetical protein